MRENRSAKLARILACFLAGLLTTSFGTAQEKRNSECAEDLSADTGQPVMFQHGPLTWGLSTRPIMYGQKLLVLLWIHNPTDKPLSVATCGNIDYFWAYEIEVLDSHNGQACAQPCRGEAKAGWQFARDMGVY
jgi:hypothetical protein